VRTNIARYKKIDIYIPRANFHDIIVDCKHLDLEDEETIPEAFFNISLIDDIVGEFFKQYHLSNMLSDVERFGTSVVVPYKFKDVTYEATIDDYRTGYPDTHHQLTVRLSHDGYRYRKINSQFVVEKNVNYRVSGGWLVLDSSFLEEMPHLKNIAIS